MTISQADLRPGMRLRVIYGNWMGSSTIGRIYVVSDPLRIFPNYTYDDPTTSYYVEARLEGSNEGSGHYTIDQFEIAEQYPEPEPLDDEEVKELWY